ncbi:MAG: hypothetical protein HN742_20905 [Lentisphaerae bacterium]|jgi:hypothetical protein|nr:hypothetical protein [Lentisphaerota bacterium]MBT4823213.1 hypothetical protein [Lentisphaerota bacterium]MBT5610723.1 hypothetical protein [Lentisphaerota bacterium]MBT7054292.1 hypothetical protein [Lentisphaerota bacterium]MBT7844353.1 hypothetical protein [Lentisphaerota bacterium]
MEDENQNSRILTAHIVSLMVVFGWPVLFFIYVELHLHLLSNPAMQTLAHVVAGLQALTALALAVWGVKSVRGWPRPLLQGLGVLSTAIQLGVIFFVHRGLIALLKW